MTRRDALKRLFQTAAGAALVHTIDVDRLLWQPGSRRIFLPRPNPFLGLTIDGIPHQKGAILVKGDLITIDGIPHQLFIVTEDFTADSMLRTMPQVYGDQHAEYDLKARKIGRLPMFDNRAYRICPPIVSNRILDGGPSRHS